MMLTTMPAKTIMSKIFEFFVMVVPMFFFRRERGIFNNTWVLGCQGIQRLQSYSIREGEA